MRVLKLGKRRLVLLTRAEQARLLGENEETMKELILALNKKW